MFSTRRAVDRERLPDAGTETCWRSPIAVDTTEALSQGEQSTSAAQDKENENREAKNVLSDVLKKVEDLEKKEVPQKLDSGGGNSIPKED